MVGVVAWPTAAVWGHAEDSLAVTFALYAMVAMLDRRWARMGWLFGFGIALQPLVGLMLPLFLGCTPRGQRLIVAVRSAALSAFLVLDRLLPESLPTPTGPWCSNPRRRRSIMPPRGPGLLPSYRGAPRPVAIWPDSPLGPARDMSSFILRYVTGGQSVVEVAGGPGRMIDVVLALMIGIYVWRRPQPPDSDPLAGLGGAGLPSVLRAGDDPLLPGTTPYPLSRHGFPTGGRSALVGGGHRPRNHRVRLSPSEPVGVVAACGSGPGCDSGPRLSGSAPRGTDGGRRFGWSGRRTRTHDEATVVVAEREQRELTLQPALR